MAKLIEAYSRSTGLEIKKPFLGETFYLLSFDKYITIQNGSGMPNAKNYDYWQEVIFGIKPILDANNIKIVLLGASEDQVLGGVEDLRGKTNIQQSNYIIGRSLLHIGNDSCLAHIAGFRNIPLICLYGSTTIANHSPYWYNKDKTIFLESHRFGDYPSFSSQESPKTVNLISPESVINAIFKLLGIEQKAEFKTFYIGQNYLKSILEYIPTCPFTVKLNESIPVVLRMDFYHNPQAMIDLAQKNIKYHLIINKQVDINLIKQLKQFIIAISIEMTDEITPKFVKDIKNIGIKCIGFINSDDTRNLGDIRLKFFDLINIDKISSFSLEDFKNRVKNYLNQDDDFSLENMKFKTNKVIFANNKVYASKAHFKKDIAFNLGGTSEILDDHLFWEDFEHFYFLKNE